MDIPVHSIAALRKGYAEGRWSVKAVAEAVLVRAAAAETVDPAIWIARVAAEQLLAEAAALDAKGPAGLPLFGVPFAVKDNIDVAGLPTTAACPAFAYQPERSATVVERLRAAGALLVGKTNLDQFATGLVGVRSPYGAPRSPFDSRYVSGGSSSGSAVAVVARPRQFRARHRHRRFGPRPGRVLQPDRPQAEPRIDQRRRRRAGLPVARLRLDLRHQRRRRGRGAVGGGGLRPRRPLQPRAAGADRRPAAARAEALPLWRAAQAGPHVLRRRRSRGAVPQGGRKAHAPRRRSGRDRPHAVLRRRAPALRRAVGGRAHRCGRRISRRPPGRRRPDRRRASSPRAWTSPRRRRSTRCIGSRRSGANANPPGARSTSCSRRRRRPPTPWRLCAPIR